MSKMDESDKSLWRHPHGMDVLKRLGIVERSTASISEDEHSDQLIERIKHNIPMIYKEGANGGALVTEESDDNEFIFDRASLIQRVPSIDDDRGSAWFTNRRTETAVESRQLCCRGVLAALAYFVMGSCVSIIGPTLGNLQFSIGTDFLSSGTSILSANAFGAMIGIILCTGCNTLLNPFCILMFALTLSSLCTLIVPWCTTLASASAIFMLQGVAFGLIERGGYSIFHSYWRRRYSVLAFFYVCLAVGAGGSGLIISPMFTSNSQNISMAQSSYAENSSDILALRMLRDTGINPSCNVTVDDNCTSTITQTKMRKPPVSDATHMDAKRTETKKKEEALAKLNQPATSVKPESETILNATIAALQNETTPTTKTIQTTTMGLFKTSVATTTPPISVEPAAWAVMQENFARLNGFQLAYVTVASICIVLSMFYAVACCCSACTGGNGPSGSKTAGEYRLQLNGLWKARYAVMTASAAAFLVVGFEAILSSLLTVYACTLDASHFRGGIIATSSFWLSVSMARILSICFYSRLSQTAAIASCLGLALFCTGVAVVFEYWTVIGMMVFVLGLCYGCLYPLTYCWLDQQLSPGPWFSTIWCLAGQTGRLLGPLCASSAMAHHSPKDFLLALLVSTLLTCIVYVLMRSTVREAAQFINVEQKQRVTCKVRFPGSDALLEYHHFTNVEADDDVTRFDRSRDANVMTNGGMETLVDVDSNGFEELDLRKSGYRD